MAAKSEHNLPSTADRTNDVPTQVKDPDLVERRRRQIVDAAVKLFIDQGFHKTTTRQIAKESGFSIGTLYEYIRTKEDVLFLVCDAIHAEVERGVAEVSAQVTGGREALRGVIREYFMVCDRMSGHILLIYQETGSLPPQWQKKVLENEVRVSGLFREAIIATASEAGLDGLGDSALDLMAHNITVLGHMWTFRRWYLTKKFSIEEYIAHQTALILRELAGGDQARGRRS